MDVSGRTFVGRTRIEVGEHATVVGVFDHHGRRDGVAFDGDQMPWVRTRLREAAFALAHERPVDEMTVGDIGARARVSRQVFYQHFHDRDDAIATAFSVAFAAATAVGGSLDGTAVGGSLDGTARILRLVDFAAQHRSM